VFGRHRPLRNSRYTPASGPPAPAASPLDRSREQAARESPTCTADSHRHKRHNPSRVSEMTRKITGITCMCGRGPCLPCIVDWPGIGPGQRCVRLASPSSRGGLILLDDAGGDPAAVAQIDRVGQCHRSRAGASHPLVRRRDPLRGRRLSSLPLWPLCRRWAARTVPITCPAAINRNASAAALSADSGSQTGSQRRQVSGHAR
jgi:hypothetical protein